jgi:septal ring factor EnvC (AmiA/AmiB activator)
VSNLTKSRSKLNKTIDDYKYEVSGLKKQLKAIESEHVEKAASIKVDYDNILQEKNQEISQVRRSLDEQ